MNLPVADVIEGVPAMIAPAWHVQPCPRRVRAVLGGATVLDTTAALYVWEWPGYPQFYVPLADVRGLGSSRSSGSSSAGSSSAGSSGSDGRGTYETRALGSSSAVVVLSSDIGLAGYAKLDWAGMDAWYEEDEQVFVHPRNPYTRVDALRSTRHVVVSRDGVELASSSAPVLLFETGLPTRYYLPRLDVNWAVLIDAGVTTECPYKGRTSGYWSVQTPARLHKELAWSYDFPTAALPEIRGMVAFLNERVDITLDGVALPRPRSRFS